MKLKKLLAAVTAAAMAFTTLTVPAMAEDSTFDYTSITAGVYYQNGEDGGWTWIGSGDFQSLSSDGTGTIYWDQIGVDTKSGDSVDPECSMAGSGLGIVVPLGENGENKYKPLTVTITSMEIGGEDRLPQDPVMEGTFDTIDEDNVTSWFDIGITPEDVGKALDISFKVDYDPSAEATMQTINIPFTDKSYFIPGSDIDAEPVDVSLERLGIAGKTLGELKKGYTFIIDPIYENNSLGIDPNDFRLKIFMFFGDDPENWENTHGIITSLTHETEFTMNNMWGDMDESLPICRLVYMVSGRSDDDPLGEDVVINQKEIPDTYSQECVFTDNIKLTVMQDEENGDLFADSEMIPIDYPGVMCGKTTLGELRGKQFTITNIPEYRNCSYEGAGKRDIQMGAFISGHSVVDEDTGYWEGIWDSWQSINSTDWTVNFDDIIKPDADDNIVIDEFNYYVTFGNYIDPEKYNAGDTITVNYPISMNAYVYTQMGADDEWYGAYAGYVDCNFEGNVANETIYWDEIGSNGDEFDKKVTYIAQQGLNITTPGYEYIYKPVTLRVTKMTVDGVERTVEDQTLLFEKDNYSDQGDRCIACFDLGLNDDDLGKPLYIEFEVEFDPTAKMVVEEIDMRFQDIPYTFHIESVDWSEDFGRMAVNTTFVDDIDNIKLGETTFGDIKDVNISLYDLRLTHLEEYGLSPEDIFIAPFISGEGDGQWADLQNYIPISDLGTYVPINSEYFNNLDNFGDDDVITGIGYQMLIDGNKGDGSIDKKNVNDKITINNGEGTHYNYYFDGYRPYDFNVESASGDGYTKMAMSDNKMYIPGIIPGETTYGELKNADFTVKNIDLCNLTERGLTTDDIRFQIYFQFGDSYLYGSYGNGSIRDYINNGGIMTFNMSEIEFGTDTDDEGNVIEIQDTDKLINMAFQLYFNGSCGDGSVEDMDTIVRDENWQVIDPGDTFTINAAGNYSSFIMDFKDRPYELRVMPGEIFNYAELDIDDEANSDTKFDVKYGTTYENIKDATITINSVKLSRLTEMGLKPEDVQVNVYANIKDAWSQKDYNLAETDVINISVKELVEDKEIPDDADVWGIGYSLFINGIAGNGKINTLEPAVTLEDGTVAEVKDKVTINSGVYDEINMEFDREKPYTLKVNSFSDEYGTHIFAKSYEEEANFLEDNVTPYPNIKDATFTLSNIGFEHLTEKDLSEEEVTVRVFIGFEDVYADHEIRPDELKEGSFTIKISDLLGDKLENVDDDNWAWGIGYVLIIDGVAGDKSINCMNVDDEFYINTGDGPAEPDKYTVKFPADEEFTLWKSSDENGEWSVVAETKDLGPDQILTDGEPIEYGKTTVEDIFNDTIQITGLEFKNCSQEGIKPEDIHVVFIVYINGQEYFLDDGTSFANAESSEIRFGEILGDHKVPLDGIVSKISYRVTIDALEVEAAKALEDGDTIIFNSQYAVGDMDESGEVNEQDIDAMVKALSSADYTPDNRVGDVNGDETFDIRDLSALIYMIENHLV